MFQRVRKRKGFSLVELVVVIVIIGILAAMAIPRLSRGSAGAGNAAVAGNLATIRAAINLYAAEHNSRFPSGTAANIVAQLTQYTDVNGNTSASKTGAFIYGPYLVAIPPAPVGENAGSRTILVDSTNSPPQVDTSGGEGWVYNPNTGEFIINTTQTDDRGKAYNMY
jgi:prepilin-type N-terminal cleavage/methylation domain-containing protein